jgi:hypothetical protein
MQSRDEVGPPVMRVWAYGLVSPKAGVVTGMHDIVMPYYTHHHSLPILSHEALHFVNMMDSAKKSLIKYLTKAKSTTPSNTVGLSFSSKLSVEFENIMLEVLQRLQNEDEDERSCDHLQLKWAEILRKTALEEIVANTTLGDPDQIEEVVTSQYYLITNLRSLK